MVTTAAEHVGSVRRARRTAPPKAHSADVETRLVARRDWLRSLRKRLFLADAVVVVAMVMVSLLHGSVVAAVASVAVLLAVTIHVYDASSPRRLVAVVPVLKAAIALAGSGCVVAAYATTEPLGREVIAGVGGSALALLVLRVLVHVPGIASRCGLVTPRRLVVGDPDALASTAPRRARLVASGEVIPVVTRADRPADDTGPDHDKRVAAADGRRHSGRPTGLVERIVRTALDNTVQSVTVIPGETWQQEQLRELSWLLEGTGIDMVIATDLDGIAPHRVDVVQQEGRLNVRVGSATPRGLSALTKAAVDRVGAVVLMVLLAPVFAVLVAAVRLDSSGPVFFRQTRVRAGAAMFTMYKFRTMRVGADNDLGALQGQNIHAADGVLFKMTDDPRVTRVGGLLRRASLDELPQLLNVLKGEMSLIGPRPALPLEVEAYDYVAKRRLAVKPGMTGLWQVSGRSRLSWDESIGFDVEYVDNWSPAADAAIAVRTIRAVMTRDGAY